MAGSGLGHAYVNHISADLVFTSRLISLPNALTLQHVGIQHGKGGSCVGGHLLVRTKRDTSKIWFCSMKTKATDCRGASVGVAISSGTVRA